MNFDFDWPEMALGKKAEKKATSVSKADTSNFALKTPKAAEITKNSLKEEKLLKLKEKIQNEAQISFKKLAKNFVLNSGSPDATIMVIGEAPGEQEDIQGIPFIGKCGQLIRHFLEEAGIDDIYITNTVNWRPPNNATPTIEEIAIMKPFLREHIKIIEPKLIICVGATSLKALEINEPITRAQGNFFESELGLVYPVFHPAYALRLPSKKKELWESFLKLKIWLRNSQAIS
jgi:uracil-DNA glycosylase family 4